MVGGEITMICMDNSKWMTEDNLITWFINQSEAIELYCERKLQAHPDNLVGIIRMGELDLGVQLYPTNDLQLVKLVLDRFLPSSIHQNLDLLQALKFCKSCWLDHKHLDKRIVVFAGGPLNFTDEHLKAVVEDLKEDTGVVVDVVDFFPVVNQSKEKKLLNLIKYMNEQNNDKNKDGTYFRVEPEEEGSISDRLSTSSILPPLVAEGGRSRKKKKLKRPVQLLVETRTKKHKKHPVLLAHPLIANYYYKCV